MQSDARPHSKVGQLVVHHEGGTMPLELAVNDRRGTISGNSRIDWLSKCRRAAGAHAANNGRSTAMQVQYRTQRPNLVRRQTKLPARGRLWVAMAIALVACAPASAATLVTLHSFAGSPKDGAGPDGALISDGGGNLYGTTQAGGTYNAGTVFRLSPPPAGGTTWKATILHSFGGPGDGTGVYSSLVLGSGGALFGTTRTGGASGNGIIFRLSPPAAGQTEWKETILHSFSAVDCNNGCTNLDGANPYSGALTIDAAGNIFGATESGGNPGLLCYPGVVAGGAGTVFELSQPGSGQTDWSETVLFNFTTGCGKPDETELLNPLSGVILAPDGSLYGTAVQGGSSGPDYGGVFKLSPPLSTGGTWQYAILHIFRDSNHNDGETPYSAPVLSPDGALYGLTTQGGRYDAGAVYRLSPPSPGSTAWNESLIYSFRTSPLGASFWLNSLAVDSSGTLYGTTGTGGTGSEGSVFKLVSAGSGSTWTLTNLVSLKRGKDNTYPMGGQPSAGPLLGPQSILYGVTSMGGSKFAGGGTAFMVIP